jgi:hypothetical protein
MSIRCVAWLIFTMETSLGCAGWGELADDLGEAGGLVQGMSV